MPIETPLAPDELRRLRILHVVVAVSYPLGGLLVHRSLPETADPWWPRYLMAAVHLAVFGASFRSNVVRERLGALLNLLLFAATAHAMSLVALDGLRTPVLVYTLVVFIAVASYLPTRTMLVGYFLFNVALAAAVSWLHWGHNYAPLLVSIYAGLSAFLYFLQAGRLRTHERLAESESRFRSLFEASYEALIVHDGGQVRDVNPGFERLFRYAEDTILDAPLHLVIAPQSRAAFDNYLAAGSEEPFESVGLKENGASFYLEVVTRKHVHHGRPVRVSSMRDITERKRAEETIADAAHRDPLTDLPTPRVFLDRLTMALASARRRKEGIGVAVLAINALDQLQAELGRDLADMLILGTAARLKQVTRDSDTVARKNEDEFYFILSGVDDVGAHIAAEKIVDAFADPFVVQGRTIEISVSVGLSLYPAHSDQPKRLLALAEDALKTAKAGAPKSSVFILHGETGPLT